MLIVANWKAYVEDLAKAKKLFAIGKKLAQHQIEFGAGRARDCGVEIVLAPPAPLLGALAVKNKSRVAFAAQDVSTTTGGAQTGEITAQTYAAAGATHAIIGHSERRAAGDTDSVIADKLAHVLAQGLTPILCVGEHERDTEGHYLAVVREELTRAMGVLSEKERARIIVAYEPIWAIGKTAVAAIAPNDLAEMTLYIRKVLAELLPGRSAKNSLVLYGGSVEPSDIRGLAAVSGVDGFLVGHASVDPHTFTLLVKQLS